MVLMPSEFSSSSVTYTVACNRDTTPLLSLLAPQYASLLKFKPHYEVVDSPRYICFVPLLSTYCLVPEVMALVDSNFHILDLIQPHIRAAAAEGRCLLCFDASSEGDPFLAAAYDNLHAWLDKHAIPQRNVVLINQNRALGPIYQASTQGQVTFLEYDFYIKKFLQHFAAPASSFEEHFGFSPQSVSFAAGDKPYAFLCMNGAPRPNRLVALAALEVGGILARTEWSMLGSHAGKLSASVEHARQMRDLIGADWITDAAIDAIMDATPRLLPGEEAELKTMRDSNELANTINLAAFQSSFASIVTETEYSGGDVRRVTEKTVRAFAMGHPTVVIGNPRSLDLMKQIGFQTFSDVFDETYDSLTDGNERLVAILETLAQIEALRGDPARLARLTEICAANLAFARSGALQAYDGTFERVCLAAIIEHLDFAPT